MALQRKSAEKVRKRRIVACGRGRVIQNPKVLPSVLKLTGVRKPRVIYFGAPDYDDQEGYDLQASKYEKKGCVVDWINITDRAKCPSKAQLSGKIAKANVV